MDDLFKFGSAATSEDAKQWFYSNVWSTEQTTDNQTRLVIAPTANQVDLLIRLAKAMSGPFLILYVLVVPRTEHDPGRYQSPFSLDEQTVVRFLEDFRLFLELDGRHHLWIAANDGAELLVYDRHNVIYAYGPTTKFELILSEAQLSKVSEIRFPSPHSHHYHSELDTYQSGLISRWDWIQTPLRGQDSE